MAESKELKSLLMKVKEESEKVGLQQHFENSAFRSWHPVTSLHGKYGEAMETMRDFILGGSQITAYGDCSHEIKRRLLLGRKAMTNLDSLLTTETLILPTKFHLVKAVVFPEVMYG